MPNTERGGIGISANSIQEMLQRFGALGVVKHGALSYDVYPTLAVPTTITSSATANTDGTFASVLAASTITVPFMLHGLSIYGSQDTDQVLLRFSARETSGTVRRRFWMQYSRDVTSNRSQVMHAACTIPYIFAANQGVEVASAPGVASASAAMVYAQFLRLPTSFIDIRVLSDTTSGDNNTQSNNNTTPATSATTGGGAWSFGSYAQLVASTTLYTIITAVMINSNTVGQIACATGGAGSEVVWGNFGLPFAAAADGGAPQIWIPLPAPVLIPPSTRLSFKGAASTATQSIAAALEYYTLPLVPGWL